MADDYNEEDLFADLYEGEENAPAPAPAAAADSAAASTEAAHAQPIQPEQTATTDPIADGSNSGALFNQGAYSGANDGSNNRLSGGQDMQGVQSYAGDGQNGGYGGGSHADDDYRPIGIKEDG
ncbi:hypothetical protein H2203_004381 [Taxawa tesnikishii (nom. ined.)]|nr:hypothetical protein H2203_004381 [Dothideales sp. JES 119]